MSRYRRSIGILSVLACCAGAAAWGQQAKPAAAVPAAAGDPVLASVNGESINQSELLRLVGQFSVPEGTEQRAYTSAMEMLVNTRLLAQFLKEQRIAVAPKEIDEVVAQYDKSARENNTSLTAELANNNTALEEFRERIARTLQWQKYVMARGTDAELKKYAETNKDVFSGTQVRASHILVRVEPGASEEEKQKAKEKLVGIKKEIDEGKISFADAANKYSEDPGNQRSPSGGDLNFFPRKGQFIESFSSAAFGLKKDEVAGPVETEYGYHLIQVTDRRDGPALEFEKAKPQILEQYAAELQEQIVNAERKKAEAAGAIKVEPMPAGLIKPAAPVEAPVADPAVTKPAAPAPATAKPATAKPATPKS